MSTANTKTPLFISIALVAIGLVLGLAGSSILGGIIAACGVIPAAWFSWTGMQQETQTNLAIGISMIVVSFVMGGILLVLGLINKVW